MEDFIKKSVIWTAACVVLAALILGCLHRASWGMGLVVSAAWSIANFLLTIYLIKIAILEKNKKRLSLVLGIKFPVLYLFGFWLLSSRFFPTLSLIAGQSLVFFVMGVIKLCPKSAAARLNSQI